MLQSRLPSVFAGLITLIFTYLLARKLYDEYVGVIATILLMINNLFFVAARTVRAEIFVTAISVTAIYCVIEGFRSKRNWFVGISGTLAGIGLWTHPNAALLSASIIILFVYEYRGNFLREGALWIFLLFLIVGLLPYAIYVVSLDAKYNFMNFWAQLADRKDVLLSGSVLWRSIADEVQRYRQYVFFPYRFAILVVEIAFLFLTVVKRESKDALILLVIMIHVVLLSILISSKTARYLTVLMPFVSIIIAKVFVKGCYRFSEARLEDRKRFSKAFLFFTTYCLLLVIYAASQFGGNVYALWKYRGNDYYGFISRVKNHIPDGSKVWGSISFWWGFREFPYRTQFTYGRDVDEFKPEYVILYDADTWGNITWTTRSQMSAKREEDLTALFRGVRKKMEDLCLTKGKFAGKVEDEFYGNVEIYHIEYEK
jgi:4-amino-4-deoxy-L-arabinose transferase-like glycosyltransferase